MSFFGDLLFGARPDMRYTGAQDAAIGWGANYGEQFNPLYGQDQRQYKKYQSGNDKGGKLTRFMMPARQMMEANREGTVDEFNRYAGSGFSPGGAGYAAAGSARIRNEANRDIGNTLGGMYVQRGEQLHDRVTSAYEDAKRRELAAHQISADVSNHPYQANRQGGGLLGMGIDLLKNYFLPKVPGGGGSSGPAGGGGGGDNLGGGF